MYIRNHDIKFIIVTTTTTTAQPSTTTTAKATTTTTAQPVTTTTTTTEATTTTTTTAETTTTAAETTTTVETTTTAQPSVTYKSETIIQKGVLDLDYVDGAQYVSSDPSIAKAMLDGKIIGMMPGVATVKVYYPDGSVEVYTITVVPYEADTLKVAHNETIVIPDIAEEDRIEIEDESIVKITADGKVIGLRPGATTITIYHADGSIVAITITVTAVVESYEYKVTNKDAFYFSHDENAFKAEDLAESLRRREVYSDGTFGEWETTALTDVTVSGTPADTFTAPYFTGSVKASIAQELPTGEMYTAELEIGNVTIAALGDVDLNGEVNAVDAQVLLEYAAALGAGETPALFSAEDSQAEANAKKLADTDGNGTIDAIDASNILMYSAMMGADNKADWNEVLNTKSEPTA